MRFPILELPLIVRAAVLSLGLVYQNVSSPAATLEQLFAAVDTLSPELAAARLDVARALADYQHSNTIPNPTLFGSHERVSNSSHEEEELSYGVHQSISPIWSFGSKRGAARDAYAAAQATYEEARRLLCVDVTERVLQIHALQQKLALTDTVLFYADRVVQAMEARFRLGDVSEYDLHRLQAELLRLHQHRYFLLREQQRAGTEFIRLSGLPIRAAEDLAISEWIPPDILSADQAVEIALMSRPLLSARTSMVASAEKEHAANRWNQLPDITVGIGHKSLEPDFSGMVLEAEIELPLFTQRRSERMLSKTAWAQSRIQRDAAMLSIEQEARTAYLLWKEMAADTANMFAFDEERAGQDLERGIQMYLHGELSPVEIVDMLRSTLESRDAHLQLFNTRILAELDLRRATGLPLTEKHR